MERIYPTGSSGSGASSAEAWQNLDLSSGTIGGAASYVTGRSYVEGTNTLTVTIDNSSDGANNLTQANIAGGAIFDHWTGELDVSEFTSGFMLILEVRLVGAEQNEGTVLAVGVCDNADPTAATDMQLGGWQDQAALLNLRWAGQAQSSSNAVGNLAANGDLMRLTVRWDGPQTTALSTQVEFLPTSDQDGQGKGGSVVNQVFDITSGLHWLVVAGTQDTPGSPAGSVDLDIRARYRIIDLANPS